MLITDVADARRARGLSQKALGAMLGVEGRAISRMERGTGAFELLIRTMDALDYHVAGFATGRTFIEQLRRRRANLGWSIARTAERTGLSRNTIVALEAGRGSIASLLKLLAVVGKSARRRAPERAHWAIDKKGERDSRFTPPEFMQHVYTAFGTIDLDPCGHLDSPVVARRRILLSEGGDGLVEPWCGSLVFLNPPFSALLKWLRRADEQWSSGNAKTIVALVPARTDSAYFHDRLAQIATIGFLKGRLRFLSSQGRQDQTPFSLMVVIFGGQDDQIRRFAELVECRWLPCPPRAVETIAA